MASLHHSSLTGDQWETVPKKKKRKKSKAQKAQSIDLSSMRDLQAYQAPNAAGVLFGISSLDRDNLTDSVDKCRKSPSKNFGHRRCGSADASFSSSNEAVLPSKPQTHVQPLPNGESAVTNRPPPAPSPPPPLHPPSLTCILRPTKLPGLTTALTTNFSGLPMAPKEPFAKPPLPPKQKIKSLSGDILEDKMREHISVKVVVGNDGIGCKKIFSDDGVRLQGCKTSAPTLSLGKGELKTTVPSFPATSSHNCPDHWKNSHLGSKPKKHPPVPTLPANGEKMARGTMNDEKSARGAMNTQNLQHAPQQKVWTSGTSDTARGAGFIRGDRTKTKSTGIGLGGSIIQHLGNSK